MPKMAGLISKWECRIEELKLENKQLEDGRLKLREKRLSDDGQEIESDLTAQAVTRNKQWIDDLVVVMDILNQEQKTPH